MIIVILGFSIPNTVTVPSKDKEGKTQSRNGYYPYTSKTGLKRSSKPQKTNQANDAKIQKGNTNWCFIPTNLNVLGLLPAHLVEYWAFV